MKQKNKCCICGRWFEGYGNNPEPVKYRGRCCDRCNDLIVIDARLEQIRRWQGKKPRASAIVFDED